MNDRLAGLRVDPQSVDSMQLDGEAVLLNLATHAYFGLNATGTQVWELIRNHAGITSDDIAAALAGRYAHEGGVVGPDVESLVDDMVQHGLVLRCAPSLAHRSDIEPSDGTYERPGLQAYGNLDTLILSGE